MWRDGIFKIYKIKYTIKVIDYLRKSKYLHMIGGKLNEKNGNLEKK